MCLSIMCLSIEADEGIEAVERGMCLSIEADEQLVAKSRNSKPRHQHHRCTHHRQHSHQPNCQHYNPLANAVLALVHLMCQVCVCVCACVCVCVCVCEREREREGEKEKRARKRGSVCVCEKAIESAKVDEKTREGRDRCMYHMNHVTHSSSITSTMHHMSHECIT